MCRTFSIDVATASNDFQSRQSARIGMRVDLASLFGYAHAAASKNSI